MDPACVVDIQLYHPKLFGKDWKKYIGAVYEESAFGKARLELYQSDNKLKNMEPYRTILLENCISIRATKGQDDLPYIRLQMKDKTVFQLTSPKLLKLTDILSKATFPKKYITLPSTSLESPTSDAEEIEFFNEYPVLLLPSTLKRGRSIAEGNYILEFSDSLILKIGSNVEQTIQYSDLIWVATGDHCLGFEVEREGIFEFICGQPLQIVDHLRNYIKFSCTFTPLQIKLKNNYDRHYHPVRILAKDSSDMSISSTLESRSSTEQSLPSELMNFSLDESRIYEKSVMDRSNESIKNLQITKDQAKKDNKLLGFIRRNSKKMKNIDGNRTDFEENADGEWLKLQTPITANTKVPVIPGSETTQLFKKELEQTIAQNKKRVEEIQRRSMVILEE